MTQATIQPISSREPTTCDQSAEGAAGLAIRLEDVTPEWLACWRDLERRLGAVPLSVSSDWTETWLNHYSAIVPTRVAVGEANGKLRGICLITEGVGRNAGPVALRTRHIGTAGEPHGESVCVEYNSLLVEEAYREAFAAGVLGRVEREARFDELHLDGFLDADRPGGAQDFEVRRRESRYFDLRSAREAGAGILERLGRSTRSGLRRTLRKYGKLEVQWAESLDEADDILTELIALHQTRWRAAGESGAFASARFRAFQQELAARLVPQRRAVLFRVRHDGGTVGCLMLLVDRGRMLDYLSGFAPFEEKPSPGIVTHYLCMEQALQRGFDAYDFLVGEKRHKQNLSTDVNELVWAVHRRPTWRNGLVRSLRTVRGFGRSVFQSREEGQQS